MDFENYIHIPIGRLVEPEERYVAEVLAMNHEHIYFMLESHIHMPDIEYLGRYWEIKSPEGSSSRTIENNIRMALKQSEYIIINLGRIKMKEDKAIAEVRKQGALSKKIKGLLVVTRDRRMLYIK